MDKREKTSWFLNVVIAFVSLITLFASYHLYMMSVHEPKGSTAAALGSVFLFQRSRLQNLKNHYIDNVENNENAVIVEESKRQLKRLEYEEGYVDMMQQQLGVKPKQGE